MPLVQGGIWSLRLVPQHLQRAPSGAVLRSWAVLGLSSFRWKECPETALTKSSPSGHQVL